jgi:mono/diheme cytochrome c family protein
MKVHPAYKIGLALMLVLTLCLVGALGLRGCTSTRSPLVLFTGMADQPRFDPQAETDFFADGRTQRMPPEGAIAWGRDARAPDPRYLIDDSANFKLERMPVAVDAKLVEQGRRLFSIHCIHCHGGAGLGDGITTQYGMINPTSYHIDRLRDAGDGYIYQVITEGKGVMGPLAGKLTPAQRWAVVSYVRALQLSRTATLEDVPESRRKELEGER